MEQNNDNLLLFCVVLFPILFLCILAVYFNTIRPFSEAREYIKMEMMRTDGEEYNYWKHELKMLYVEHIPILGWFIRRFKR